MSEDLIKLEHDFSVLYKMNYILFLGLQLIL